MWELGNEMIYEGFFHHVCDEHLLKNKYLFYRFRGVDGSVPLEFQEDSNSDEGAVREETEDDTVPITSSKALESIAARIEYLERWNAELHSALIRISIILCGLSMLVFFKLAQSFCGRLLLLQAYRVLCTLGCYTAVTPNLFRGPRKVLLYEMNCPSIWLRSKIKTGFCVTSKPSFDCQTFHQANGKPVHYIQGCELPFARSFR